MPRPPVCPVILFCLLSLVAFSPAWAQQSDSGPKLLGVHVIEDKTSTHFALDLSSSTPFQVTAKTNPDRVEIDFPKLAWDSSVPASGNGGGYVTVYRKATSPEGGTRIVLETSTPVKVVSAGAGLAPPHQPVKFDLDLASDDGSSPPVSVNIPLSVAVAVKPQMLALAQKPLTAGKVPVPTAPAVLPVSLLAPEAAPPMLKKTEPKTDATGKTVQARHIIAIDPGHGGIDPGTASADGTFEKNITLASALVLKSELEATGRYTVVMTRSDDTFVKLQDRVQIARAAGAELFISLHCDAMEGREAHGATIYTLSQHASDSVAERLAAAENRSAAIGGVDLASQDDSTANILIDLSMRDSLNQSNRFAELLVSQFGERQIRLQDNIPHRSAGFAVLKAADMPSVLIEMGYLSDNEDAALLQNPRHQKSEADAITAGIDRYFKHSTL